MERIDITKRKPRRTKGTPSFYYRNVFAIGTIVTGSVLFTLFYPFIRTIEKRTFQLVEQTESERERRELFNTLPVAETTQQIQEKLEEIKKIFYER